MTDVGSPEQSRAKSLAALDPLGATSRSLTYRAIAIWLLGFMALAAVSVWGYRRYRKTTVEAISVPLHTVERSAVELTVTASGTLAFGGQQTLKSPQNEATVEQVLVATRNQVETGQPLVVLRDRNKEQELRSQRVTIQKATLDLNRNQEKVTEVQQQVSAAVEQYQESQTLLEQGFISEDEVRDDQDALDRVRSALKDAQLAVTKTELDLKAAEETLALLEQQLSDRVITSPIDGVVLKVHVSAGEAIATNTELLTLGDPTQEIVDLQLSTLDAAKVSINQPSRIRAIGPDAQDYQGRVVALSPQAINPQGAGNNSQEGQARVNTKVRLDSASQTLIPGSFVSVEIITEQQQNVLVIPPEAVQRNGPDTFVWIRDQRGNAAQQPIELGLQGLDLFEVTEGLRVGDQVALVPPTLTITPGTPISEPEFSAPDASPDASLVE
ncbi:efflux RND transporter periplasmic adaptor subunit [Leptolyngbya cf. ectocarpi LEGE 11479]|uniref:Efflux RND transporter periplasmic adaptor subunit n=1 Tax=Leptolyngbya cf. ectocarpi LEGE 11479 TaxID=1828722 RepID=A0A928X0I4_LEPEC|nr:efflux RND transporter periplasmic adaptor subunit [Leptolyngbya ectocarpi]MBE9066840.1 efflux RND transporter periplasmic adaptor subunit [Leptolyngbya cf. ectocarpi LEGE 11479]